MGRDTNIDFADNKNKVEYKKKNRGRLFGGNRDKNSSKWITKYYKSTIASNISNNQSLILPLDA